MERRAIEIRGIVQGVGFRPYVFGLASRFGLHGFVKNQTGAVLIEVEGQQHSVQRFMDQLIAEPPALARIEHLSWKTLAALGLPEFRIVPSSDGPSSAGEDSPIFISPDVAVCEACLREMADPTDRRYRYPFNNCTQCGPRLTIITGAPYDRPRTTMADFAMCADCRAEYQDPANRRFHAQPTACPVCGPRLALLTVGDELLAAPSHQADPLVQFAAALMEGRIGALKGLGGYHLVCDARREDVVQRLRQRKQRDEKPLAIMVPNCEAAAVYCELGPQERDLLRSPARPIVLLRKRSPTATIALGALPIALSVAPGNPLLGVMLPYTPLHHLLMHAVGGIPLVMTSGNRSDEPIAYEDEDALARLGDIADLFLTHNRPIHVRCDDSVTRVVAEQEMPLRRSRGYAPQPVTLPLPCGVPILAVGGQLKATFALGRGQHAFLSHHLGDLDHYEAFRAFERDVPLYEELFAVRPRLIAHDLHPDYASTRYAVERATREGLTTLPVQHHHAHLASCLAEHGHAGPAIGVIFDGTGLGIDGAIWGGEFLIGDAAGFRRAAHLRYVGLPGGEQAVRQPWRMALSYVLDSGESSPGLDARWSPPEVRVVRQMLERGFNCPLTSSAGRLFDAVASLVGVRDRVSYEGQAAIELEWLATGVAPCGAYPFEIQVATKSATESKVGESPCEVDLGPMIRAIAADVRRGVAAPQIARRFQTTLTEMIAVVCDKLRAASGLNRVALSGGVFMNALLAAETESRLQQQGFDVYRHRLVPTNDGGLSLGQLAIAARHVANDHASPTVEFATGKTISRG